MTRNIYFTFSFLFLTTFLTGQTTLSGHITDLETAEDLIGANIVVMQNGAYKFGASTDFDGKYSITLDPGTYDVEVSYIGFPPNLVTDVLVYQGRNNKLDVQLDSGDAGINLDEVVVMEYKVPLIQKDYTSSGGVVNLNRRSRGGSRPNAYRRRRSVINKSQKPVKRALNTEQYVSKNENIFKKVDKNPLVTFSIDVDAASYSNIRRFINNGQLPPKDAVRIEEMINYFNYDYPLPKDNTPFSVHAELGQCPWKNEHLLLHVGLQGKEIPEADVPPSNIVFLLDVSGSMSSPNKLPLLKSSLKLLIKQLRKVDKVAIVVYAGSSGLVLKSTPGNQHTTILESLNRLTAGGSTAGKAGLELAYQIAKENFIENGNNRIVLATDGDFNVGPSSDGEMKRLIEKNRENGVFISVLGFGMGNYKDSKMETIADNGNGNYAYIDNILEAEKVFVKEFGGTMHTIAKDVKFQLEFNPAAVSEYRLIGYTNRLLQEEDFKNDKKDAGDIGAGHNVTALFEIKLAKQSKRVNRLKYQKSVLTTKATVSNDLVTLKLRYKKPKGLKSILVEKVIKNEPVVIQQTTNNFNFSIAVAEFGMLLRDSKYKGNATWKTAIEFANFSKGADKNGYRTEMIKLMEQAKNLKR